MYGRILVALSTVVVLASGCARGHGEGRTHAQVPPSVEFSLDSKCMLVYPTQLPTTHCSQIKDTPLFLCDNVVIKPECILVRKPPTEPKEK